MVQLIILQSRMSDLTWVPAKGTFCKGDVSAKYQPFKNNYSLAIFHKASYILWHHVRKWELMLCCSAFLPFSKHWLFFIGFLLSWQVYFSYMFVIDFSTCERNQIDRQPQGIIVSCSAEDKAAKANPFPYTVCHTWVWVLPLERKMPVPGACTAQQRANLLQNKQTKHGESIKQTSLRAREQAGLHQLCIPSPARLY